ncbi:MAG: dihydrodipicolinate reductase [Planctomycetota bacterium]
MSKLRVVSFGLGPIGVRAAQLAHARRNLELVGAIDVDPAKAGKDLGDLFQPATKTGITIEADIGALDRLRPDVVVHCTSSFMPVVEQQVLDICRRGIDIVSSTEELLVPDLQHPSIAASIDQAAKAGGATVLGTGVNPGFAMDFMAVVASAVTYSVQHVRCVRVVDAGTRRLPLQQKVGAGMTTDEFEAKRATGRFGHIGMRESVALVARALGFEIDRNEQSLEPVLATEERKTPFLTVSKGAVAGIRNIGRGSLGSRVLIELDLSMYVGAPDPRDEVHLRGDPDVDLIFQGGIAGDSATAAILINSIAQVAAASPGLKTVLDVAPPRSTAV